MGAETTVREQLAANPNVIVVSERTEDWPFKGDGGGILEFTKIRVAPAESIKDPITLNDFMDGLFTGVDSRRFQRSVGKLNFYQTPGDNANLFILPRLVFFEETRGVEICVYPDRAIAELYARYEPRRSIGVNIFPPGTQKDLEYLWNSLTPQLYRRWLAGEDLASFYFTPEGKFIPRFYKIPAHKIGAIKKSRPAGAFLPDGDFTEVFQVADGSEAGARIMLWRTYKNLTPKGLSYKSHVRYTTEMGLMSNELEAVQIFPE